MAESERRRYFRINDDVGMSYRKLEASGDGARSADDVSITLEHVLQGIDRELNTLVNTLWSEQPSAARAIGLLNRKINVLASRVIEDDINARELASEVVPVNISACGVSFTTPEQFGFGQLMALDITLKPSNTILSLTGKVISCDPATSRGDSAYRLRVDFEGIGADAQEQLIQHIVQRQSAGLASK